MIIFDKNKDNPRKSALSAKIRLAFGIAALSVGGAAMGGLLDNKDDKSGLEKPGLVLMVKEQVESFDRDAGAKIDDASPARMTQVQNIIAETKLGRDLLKMASDHGVTIRFMTAEDTKEMADADRSIAGGYKSYYKSIIIDPHDTNNGLAQTLVHELRHAWQDKHINYKKLEMALIDPAKQMILNRFLEADAYAFESHFALDYERETGKRFILGGDIKSRFDPHTSSSEARDAMRRDIVDGLDAETVRANGLKIAFAFPRELAYHDKFFEEKVLEWFSGMREFSDPDMQDCSAPLAKRQAFEFQSLLQTSPSTSAFAAELRKFGVPGIDPSAKNYLDHISDADLTSDKWTGGTKPELEKSQQAMMKHYAKTVELSENMVEACYQRDKLEAEIMGLSAEVKPTTPVKTAPAKIKL